MPTVRSVREIMTHTVATCPPDATLVQAAKLMKDLNIGDVVVTADGKIKGIVTDRDITVRAVAEGDDVRVTTLKEYMTESTITGKPDWDLEKVADTMSKHQIRRLPIVENDRLVGIVSLGDVARHARDKSTVAGSLKGISEPEGLHRVSGRGLRSAVAGMMLATLMGAAVSFLFISRPGRKLRQQLMTEIEERDLSESALKVMQEARAKLEEVAASLATMQPKQKRRPFGRFG